ncbi:hypothetical protein GCM10010302_16630 [Streptomyces polychromogenes]|uniref:Ricin B lectin domain-containing protein n=1 Tax=Streptomyces polychromogenes TaxID=67342 RepID=A0ABN0V874_9ACTN
MTGASQRRAAYARAGLTRPEDGASWLRRSAGRRRGPRPAVEAESIKDGAQIVQWEFFASKDNMKWNLEYTSGGYCIVRAVNSSKCLAVSQEATNDGANFVQWADVDHPNQQFRLA